MRSLHARYEEQKRKNPSRGDYINMVNAVKGQNFTLDTVSSGFSKSVPRDEYARKDKKSLIRQLMVHTKCTEEHSFEGVKGSATQAKNKDEEDCMIVTLPSYFMERAMAD